MVFCYLECAFGEGLDSDPVVGAEEGGAGDGGMVHGEDDGYGGAVGVDGEAFVGGFVGIGGCDCGRRVGVVADLKLAPGAHCKRSAP